MTPPSTPMDKIKDISFHLGDLLQHFQQSQDSEGVKASFSDIRELVQCFLRQQTAINELIMTPSPTTTTCVPPPNNPLPDYFNNAKFEDIICRPIKPLYDGIADNLVPFLNRLDIRSQDVAWGSITFLNVKYDLIKHFAKIDESVITKEATYQWSTTTIDKDKHQPQHPTFHSRILAKLLLCSLTDDFSTASLA
jgi:hypothetical protein